MSQEAKRFAVPRLFTLQDSERERARGFVGGLLESFQRIGRPTEAEKPVGAITVRKMDLRNPRETQSYVNFLMDERNRHHFADPPESVEDLRRRAKESPGTHFLTGTIVETDESGNKFERFVGGAAIEDNSDPKQHDHWIGLFVVDPERQGQGLGKKLLLQTIEWGFNNLTYHKRPRRKLDISVILDADELRRVVGEEALNNEIKMREAIKKLKEEKHPSVRMIQLADFFDFRPVSVLFDEFDAANKAEPQPTARFELTAKYWREKLHKDKKFREQIDALRAA
jgi:RimJ/RimL family protein N-acetyltransferase